MQYINVPDYPNRFGASGAVFDEAAAWVEFVQIGVGIPGKVTVRVYQDFTSGMGGGTAVGFYDFVTGENGFPTLQTIMARTKFAAAYQALTEELAEIAAEHIPDATIVTVTPP